MNISRIPMNTRMALACGLAAMAVACGGGGGGGGGASAPPSTVTISGNAGIGGALLIWSDPAAKTATADASGNFSFPVSYGWTGNVTPSDAGYTFTPAKLSFSDLKANEPNQDFAATFTPAFPGFDFTLAQGDFWEFSWDSNLSTWVAGGSPSTTLNQGMFRVSLGAPTTLAGITAYPVQVTGKVDTGNQIAPRWTYLAMANHQIMGSTDGKTLSTIFDSVAGKWVDGGFFFDFSGNTLTKAASGTTVSSSYLTGPADVATRSSSSSDCQYFAGIGTICGGGSSSDRTQQEYFKAGIGPIGCYYMYASSGSDYESSYGASCGLICSSFTAGTGTIVLTNNSGAAVNVFNFWLESGKNRGQNLFSTPLANGSSYTFTGVLPGAYNCSATTSNGLNWGWGTGWTVTAGQTTTLNFGTGGS